MQLLRFKQSKHFSIKTPTQKTTEKYTTSFITFHRKFDIPNWIIEYQISFTSFRLHTGWSSGSSGKPPGTLQPEEKMAILEVIQRNEQLETAERQRVGRLVERVEKIKQRAAECGPRYCRLVNTYC